MVFFERNSKLLSEYQKLVYEKMQLPTNVNTFPDTLIGFGQNDNGVIDNIVLNVSSKLYVAGTEAEGETWANGIDTTAHTFIVFGLGLGYHVEKLISKYPTANIYVIEPDKRVFGHAMHLRDMEKVIRGCTIWLDETVVEAKMKAFEMLTHPLARGMVLLPFFSAVYQGYSTLLYAEMTKVMNDWAVMLNTKRTLADKWYGNRFINVRCPSVNFKSLLGKFKGVPGIIVGAGPSLQTQIEKLRSLQGKAVIIAASTAAQILKTHGITPTFMIAIDQDPVTSGALHEHMDGDIPLIFDGQIAQNSLGYKGRKFQMSLNVNRYTNMVVPDLPIIESGPSVANVAMDILNKCGCDPILIAGLDLSYTDGKLYCDGTEFNKDVDCNESLMKMLDNTGVECSTEPSFLSMRNWYEEYIARVKPPVFNCTARGVPIPGAENKSLDDFAFRIDYNFGKMLDDCYYKPGTDEPDFIDLSNYERITKELLNELDKIAESVKNVGSITPEMASLRAWSLLDELVSATVYLHELRSEHQIATGKLGKEDAVKGFQKKRSTTILEQVEVMRGLLMK